MAIWILFGVALGILIFYLGTEWGASRERTKLYDQIIKSEYYELLTKGKNYAQKESGERIQAVQKIRLDK